MLTEQYAELHAAVQGELSDGALLALVHYIASCQAQYASRGVVELPGVTFRQTQPQGQAGGEIKRPRFSKPPEGVVKLARALGPPVADDDPRLPVPQWHIEAQPVDDRFGVVAEGDGALDPPISILVAPTGDGEPVIEEGDLLQYSFVPDDSRGDTYTPKIFDHLCENRWLSRLRDNDLTIECGDGAPVDGTTGAGVAGTGSLYIDHTNGGLWQNVVGTIDYPVWCECCAPTTT